MYPARGTTRAYFPIRKLLEAEHPGCVLLEDPPPLRPFYSWTDEELERHFNRTRSQAAMAEAHGRVAHLAPNEWPLWLRDAFLTWCLTRRLRFRSAEHKRTLVEKARTEIAMRQRPFETVH